MRRDALVALRLAFDRDAGCAADTPDVNYGVAAGLCCSRNVAFGSRVINCHLEHLADPHFFEYDFSPSPVEWARDAYQVELAGGRLHSRQANSVLCALAKLSSIGLPYRRARSLPVPGRSRRRAVMGTARRALAGEGQSSGGDP